MKIGVLGTGMVGNAIASKLVALGHEVMMGSRTSDNAKAQTWAKTAGARGRVGTFAETSAFGELVFNCTQGTGSLAAILDEFLPSLVGRPLVDEILTDGPRWFRPDGDVFIPLEFADAAYRYGHCQIRHKYRLNLTTEPLPIFPDLLGFRAVPRAHTVDWTLFFDASGNETAQRAKKIDGRLPSSLIHLPVAITGECEIDEYHSLAVRDLQRGQGSDCHRERQ
jgi:NADP oxidoreductase coenzyme F420-dependent